MANNESKQSNAEDQAKNSMMHDGDMSIDFRSTGLPQAANAKPKSLNDTEGRQSYSEASRFSFGAAGLSNGSRGESRHVKIKMIEGVYENLVYYLEDKPTVAWLYSEYYRMLISSVQPSKNGPGVELHKVLLCSESGDLNVDYILSDYSETLDKLPEGIKLVQYDKYNSNGSVTLKDVTIIKNIGVGGFSKVFLVRRNDTGQFSALKFVSKKDLKKNSKEEYAFNEKKLLTKLSHKFINKFLYSFQTQNFLCFGLEYCHGGCLFDLLKKHRNFSEDVVRVCIAQVGLSLAYLHKKGVIYRDLKVACW